MSTLAPSIVIAIWVSNVHARNETLIHGWRPEPQGRGTWSILWSCLATIFICTWSALHLDVPKHHGRWYLLFRKLGWMLLAAAAPEWILMVSAENFFVARDLLKNVVKQGNQKWTLTHMQFAVAGGFWIRTPEGDRPDYSLDDLWAHIQNKSIDGPPIAEEELQARGKSDLVVKLIALLQIIWFVIQTLLRATQHHQITALEIMTVAFVFCSAFIYGFALHQPQDVLYPVVLETRNVAPTTDDTTPERFPGNSTQEGEDVGLLIRRLERVRSGLASTYVRGWATKNVPDILFPLFGCGFGALHCLAWNSPFPTSKERLAWRVCSVTTTVFPALQFLLNYRRNLSRHLISMAFFLGIVPYIVGRVTNIVLAFTALRALPADAFQTVMWTNYFPHFAA